jgi:hypothetical protein
LKVFISDHPKYQYLDNPITITTWIIKYCEVQAKKDDRMKSCDNYKFNDNALIHTYGVVEEQIQHIDSILPNYQFALGLGNDTPITKYWKVKYEETIVSIHDIKQTILCDVSHDTSTI